MALLSASLKEEFTDSVKEAWLWLWAFLTRSMAQVRSPRALKRATYRTHSPPVLVAVRLPQPLHGAGPGCAPSGCAPARG